MIKKKIYNFYKKKFKIKIIIIFTQISIYKKKKN